jgi:hypothetical protein
MEVHIWLDQAEPPVGRLTVRSPLGAPDATSVEAPFTGWLGLLRALSDAIASHGGDTPSVP